MAHAFRTLSKRGSSSSGYLADDPARETFAQGIVEVLDADAGIKKERSSRPGQWGDSYRPSSRTGDRFGGPGSRPNSRNDDRLFPPLGSSRPNSRNADRFPPLGSSRPDSRNAGRFPALGGGRPSSRNGDLLTFGRGPSSRPDSRNDDRLFPPLGSSRPNSRNADRFPPLGSRPESRTSNRFGGADNGNSNTRTFGASDARIETRHNRNGGFGGADKYRPDPRIQGRWR
jgi:hypothetical protein